MDIKMQALDSSMAILDLAFFIGIWYTIIKKPFSNPLILILRNQLIGSMDGFLIF